jgi:transcriptional regulator with XRE-family HTH domain
MERTKLATARYEKGWSQEEVAERVGVTRNTFSKWERGIVAPYPIHIHRLCEVYGKSASELDLVYKNKQSAKEEKMAHVIETQSTLQEHIPNGSVPDGSFEEILIQCTTSIRTCDTLSDHGGHDEIVLATHIVETYLPILQAILHTSSSHSLQAATLISKIFQVKQGTAYHLEGTEQSLAYAEEAVRYAKRGEDVTEVVTALHQLASIHEWPLPSLSAFKSRKKALTLIEEAAYLQEKQHDVVPSQIQSWVFIGQAKLQALNGLKQEAYTSISEAQTAFARNDTDLPGLYFNLVNLVRQEAITYSYLNEQERAIETFLKLIEVNDAQFAPRFPMPGRTHLSLLSEVVISSLRRSAAKKDKDLTIQLWKAELQMAQRMHSVTYIREAQTAYQIMECVWPDDAEIHDLYDLLYGELC